MYEQDHWLKLVEQERKKNIERWKQEFDTLLEKVSQPKQLNGPYRIMKYDNAYTLRYSGTTLISINRQQYSDDVCEKAIKDFRAKHQQQWFDKLERVQLTPNTYLLPLKEYFMYQYHTTTPLGKHGNHLVVKINKDETD